MRPATATRDALPAKAGHRGAPRPARPGSTLAELVVVLAILAVLAGLLTAAVLRVAGTSQAQATDATLQKLASELDKQLKEVVTQARKENVPADVLALAGGNARRARVIWVKMRLKQEFPTSYNEALNPLPAALLQANGGPLVAGDLPPKNVFVQALPAAANDPTTESSACLLLSLTQGRGGITWDASQTLGAGFIRDTDGDGVPEVIDAWGKAVYFVRCPYANADLNPGGPQPGNNDAQDPGGLLSNPGWVTTWGTLFGQLCHPVQGSASYPNLYPFVASAGVDRTIGTADDLYSYRLRKLGSPVTP
jgi:Tfp pilus assembly protein PilE